ncbi:DUF6412 domain-containing protein [Nocardia sp. CA2R105]|uniref:DUF6412 domain-containing protein n=1 Tax=Nocardia coffeae TaxID=2873381 RepID=UPI001CA7AE69|nr:DUF6412 domain-containing protein [Nocardia coffeae]MBY8855003.1 DUF6412 domain-containing protein [Nocardia coffeae]
MSTEFSDFALVLKFLAASVLLVLLPVAVGSSAQAVVAMAVAVLAVAIVALIGAATESAAGRAPVDRRDDVVGCAACRQSDPDAAGHVRARAPGRTVRSA